MDNLKISHNGSLIAQDQAVLPITHIEFGYGFGVYETIRLRNGFLYFLDMHLDRLMRSAKAIGLEHSFTTKHISNWILELIQENNIPSINLKLYLIGGKKPDLFILPLAPKFVEKKLYKTGTHVITAEYERYIPQAKTLNMLPSYMLYKQASQAGAYDALLYSPKGTILEGTRTNVFFTKGNTLYTPKEEHVLPGVTRATVIACAQQHGYNIVEQDIDKNTLNQFDGCFITSTSTKILPIHTIDTLWKCDTIVEPILELQKHYNAYQKAKREQVL